MPVYWHVTAGALGAEATHRTIPNSVVKPCYGDDTLGEALRYNSLVPANQSAYDVYLSEFSTNVCLL